MHVKLIVKKVIFKTIFYNISISFRLFFGMGFVWYFEIIGFLADATESEFWWIPDTLNMLQVYIQLYI